MFPHRIVLYIFTFSELWFQIKGTCTYPTEVQFPSLWYLYHSNIVNDAIVFNFTSDYFLERPVKTEIPYIKTFCHGGLGDVSKYISAESLGQSKSPECAETRLNTNGQVLLRREKALASFTTDATSCPTKLTTVSKWVVLVRYPFDFSNGTCPFTVGKYQVMYSSDSSSQNKCKGDANSIATVSGNEINIKSCFSGSPTYETPFSGTLTCVSSTAGSMLNNETRGGVLIMARKDTINRFYCARYKTEGAKTHLSLDVGNKERAFCYENADYSKFGTFEGSTFRKFTFESLDSTTTQDVTSRTTTQKLATTQKQSKPPATSVFTKIPSVTVTTNVADPCQNAPCRNGGKCTVVNRSFKCECKEGFQGKTCDEETSVGQSEQRFIIVVTLVVLLVVIIGAVVLVAIISCRVSHGMCFQDSGKA